ncbi:MAG: hypothetical protein J5835_04440 [Bacteroidales bacterium]|nr:hypothetical protein [Bacteroidales bacterium]
MNDQQLESFLRENRPKTEKDPTFILETRRRMAQVEGIKAEVERTRRSGRVALIVALAAGIVVGASITALAYFFPVKPEIESIGWLTDARVWIQTYRQYLLWPVAFLIAALALVLSLGRKSESLI